MSMDLVMALDLGPTGQFTALAVVERTKTSSGLKSLPIYSLRHLHRFPMGTAYSEILDTLKELIEEGTLAGCPLIVDQTGVGLEVIRFLRKAKLGAAIKPLMITSGTAIQHDEQGMQLVPRKELVACLQLLLQNKRLKIARELPDADLLVRELQSFQAKIPLRSDTSIEFWREGPHDDLVLATGIACWWRDRYPPLHSNSISVGTSPLMQEIGHLFLEKDDAHTSTDYWN